MSFYEEFDNLMANEVATWPTDKQKHFHVSKALVAALWVKKCSTPVGMALEAALESFYIGVAKEANDKGLPVALYQKLFDSMIDFLPQLEKLIKVDGLDEGDLEADLMGVLVGTLKNLRANKRSD
jgi:hypothetical protein